MPHKPVKTLKSARVDRSQLARVRRYLGADTDSQAIAWAIAHVDEERLFHDFLDDHGGKLTAADWEAHTLS